MPTARILSATGPIELYFEEPGLFNQHVGDFLAAVESGRWGTWKRAVR
jgi:hypothetical protein